MVKAPRCGGQGSAVWCIRSTCMREQDVAQARASTHGAIGHRIDSTWWPH